MPHEAPNCRDSWVPKPTSTTSLDSLPSYPRARNHLKSLYIGVYIYIIYTPNLGLRITTFDREREQGRFRGSSEGARESNGRATGEQRGSNGGAGGSTEGVWESKKRANARSGP